MSRLEVGLVTAGALGVGFQWENLKILSDLLSGNIKEAGSDIGILIAKKIGIPGIESSDFFKPDLIVKGVTTSSQF